MSSVNVGNVMILGGLVALGSIVLDYGSSRGIAPTGLAGGSTVARIPVSLSSEPPDRGQQVTASAGDVEDPAAARMDYPITRLVAAGISLDTLVTPAPSVETAGVRTWEVPAFSAGHAQHTAGAGQDGNAVVFGHVSSRDAGEVFRNLHRLQIGDVVSVFSSADRFDYRVRAVHRTSRDDGSIVDVTSGSTLSLVTCAGLWSPLVWDYLERLVVSAELIGAPAD